MADPLHQITRLRREPRRRTLVVAEREMLGPQMLRLRFACDDLADFDSAAPDDHIKLFLPGGARDGGRPAMRDYTPRSFDAGTGRVVIDFALHEAGPATAWAMGAGPGDTIQIGGPRGSLIVADDFDWYLLVGDETALPSIARRLEELRADVPVTVLAMVDDATNEITLPERVGLDVRWVHRDRATGDADRAVAALATALPAGEGYVWIAAEASVARAIRRHVIDVLGHPIAWVKAAGYWTRGIADAHERIED